MLEVRNSNRNSLVRIASQSTGESFVFDGNSEETGNCVGQTNDGHLLVVWGNGGKWIEAISPEKFGTIILDDEQMNQPLEQLFTDENEVVLVANPFGGWFADKASGIIKRRKATKAFKKRLKAESYLDSAREAEASAISAVKKKTSRTAKMKKFDVNFYGDGELHQATITAANKTAALKIAKKGQTNFLLDSIEEVEEKETKGWW